MKHPIDVTTTVVSILRIFELKPYMQIGKGRYVIGGKCVQCIMNPQDLIVLSGGVFSEALVCIPHGNHDGNTILLSNLRVQNYCCVRPDDLGETC